MHLSLRFSMFSIEDAVTQRCTKKTQSITETYFSLLVFCAFLVPFVVWLCDRTFKMKAVTQRATKKTQSITETDSSFVSLVPSLCLLWYSHILLFLNLLHQITCEISTAGIHKIV